MYDAKMFIYRKDSQLPKIMENTDTPMFYFYNCLYNNPCCSGVDLKDVLNTTYVFDTSLPYAEADEIDTVKSGDVIVIESEDNISAYRVSKNKLIIFPAFIKQHMFYGSAYRDTPVYRLCAADVLEVLLDMDLDRIGQKEIRKIVAEVEAEISIDWDTAIRNVIENYMSNKEENNA